MKVAFVIILGFSNLIAAAQTMQHQINEQVWRPFIKAYNEKDTYAFLAVHSKDVIRSPRDANKVMNFTEYASELRAINADLKAKGITPNLELRFTERIASNDQAIEVGIYKGTITGPDGKSMSFYGRFHVALRKEAGVWKILVDTDYSENNTIGQTQFEAAKPM